MKSLKKPRPIVRTNTEKSSSLAVRLGLTMPRPPKRYIPEPLTFPLPPQRFRFNPDTWYRNANPQEKTFFELVDTLEARLDSHQEMEPHAY